MDDPAYTLLNPGPINVSEAVRRALADSPDQCHREAEYLDLQGRVRDLLVDVFDVAEQYEAALLTGSGTAGMEAMVSSVVGTGVLVIDNGVYGDRLAQMAEAHAIPCKRLTCSWLERPDVTAVATALDEARAEGLDIDTVAMVHHETTTGLLNEMASIAALARKRGKRFIVDSVSGLGGEAFDFDAIAPAAVCCTANKCIQGLPGVSFVLVRKDTPLTKRSVYLDLGNMLAKQREGRTPFTPAIQVMAAFEAALLELRDETVAGRCATYASRAAMIRKGLTGLGLDLLLPPELHSNTITCARLPEGVAYPALHAHMRDEGYVIYAGQGKLGQEAFRIANMGLIPDERLAGIIPALAKVVS